MSQRNKPKDHKAARSGAMAGLFSSIILQPLEVLKVNLILLPNQMKQIKSYGLLSTFTQGCGIVYKTHGPHGFYKGIVSATVRSVTAATVFFFCLENFNSALKKRIENKNISDFIASATARTCSSLASNPFTVMKTRAAMVGDKKYLNVWKNFGLIYRAEGFRGFFKGGIAMIIRDFPFGGIFYVTYNSCNSVLKHYSDSSFVYLTSGMVAGVTATTLTQPLEIVAKKLMANIEGKDIRIVPFLANIYKTEGLKGYSRGLFPRMIRKPIINATTFFFYEIFSKLSHQEKIKESG